MHTPSSSRIQTLRGSFHDIRLDFTPEPPLEERELSASANYPTSLAHLHLYVDGKDGASGVISGYLQWILGALLGGMETMLQGGLVRVPWVSDPWRFDLRAEPEHDRVWITLHLPPRWVAMDAVEVPLARFAEQVVALAYRWRAYQDSLFHAEMTDSQKGKDQARFDQVLNQAEQAVQAYPGGSPQSGPSAEEKTLWYSGHDGRLWVEKLAPGTADGRIHFHEWGEDGGKWYWDFETRSFLPEPGSPKELPDWFTQRVFQDAWYQAALQKGYQYLGKVWPEP